MHRWKPANIRPKPAALAADDGACSQTWSSMRYLSAAWKKACFRTKTAQWTRAVWKKNGRLMYVAITRARRKLYLTLSQSRMLHGQTRYNIASRFFNELPRGCCNGSIRPPPAHPNHRLRRLEQAQASETTAYASARALHPKFGAGVIIDCTKGAARMPEYRSISARKGEMADARICQTDASIRQILNFRLFTATLKQITLFSMWP